MTCIKVVRSSRILASLLAFTTSLASAACPPDTFVHAADFRLGDYAMTQSNDNFGESMASDSRVVAVGAPRVDRSGSVGGAVFLFQRGATPSTWNYLKQLTEANFAEGGDLFGSALAMQKNVLIVAAPSGGDMASNDSGKVQVFERDQGGSNQWGLKQDIVAQSSAGNVSFGKSLALARDRLLVADPQAAGSNGEVYVYERNGLGQFARVATLSKPDAGGNNHFGDTVALYADTAVVADPAYDANPSRSGLEGRVYVFQRDQGGPGQWGLVTRLVTTPADNDSFGIAVSISHDRIAVGTGVPAAGQVFVFGRDAGGSDQWGQIQRLAAPSGDAGASDGFGHALDLHKWELVVGAPGVQGAQASTGAAYVYQRVPMSSPEHWSLLQKFYAAGNNYRSDFGVAMDWSHGFAALGDPLSDDPAFPAGSKVGHTYVFFDDEIMCTPFE
ncbi:MAG: hypothetical protein WCD66_01770 [Rhodanobacteraceae bacterium]